MHSSFLEGVLHITDLGGYDHILFLLCLVAGFTWGEWKKILWLITAFTIGHATTLLCAGMGWLRFDRDLIELLIACTIFITALFRIIKPSLEKPLMWYNYLLVVFFGLIHGMGFSSFFRMMYSNTSDILLHLFMFNLGVESGQALIVAMILLLFTGVFLLIKAKRTLVVRLVLSLALFLSSMMIWEKFQMILEK